MPRTPRRGRASASPRHQAGIALLTALFVVALVSVAAAAVYASQSLALKRTANQLDGEQAWDYALGLEDLGRYVLILDTKQPPMGIDSLKDVWATQNVVFPVENGTLSGRIVDLQGAFNLNNLALPPDAQKTQAAAFTKMVGFIIDQYSVPSTSRSGQRRGNASEISDAVVDWIDANSDTTGTGGAEDSQYLSDALPTRTAGRLLTDVSEIRAVRGMTPELYFALTHCDQRGNTCISALPLPKAQGGTPPPLQSKQQVTTSQFQASAININTAPLAVLQAIPGADATKAKQFDVARLSQPYEKVADARDPTKGFLAATPPLNPDPLPIAVKSSWFRLESVSAIGGTQLAMYSTLFRPANGQPGVYSRSTAPG